MFAGDEYALLRAIAGDLPASLVDQKIAVPPAVMLRLRNSLNRISDPLDLHRRHPAAPKHGAITRRLAAVPERDWPLISDPSPTIASLLQPADIDRHWHRAIAEASAAQMSVSRYVVELTATAWHCKSDTVWVGNEQNIPRAAQSGGRLLGIQWQLLPPRDLGEQ